MDITILMNLVPIFSFIVLCLVVYLVKPLKVKVGLIVGYLLLAIIYVAFQPSALYKGQIQRTMLEPMEHSSAELQDRNRKPQAGEIYDQKRVEEFKAGPEFLRDKD